MTPLEITLLILLATILAFVSGKIPFSVISSGIILALILTGVMTPAEAFGGFINTNVVIVCGDVCDWRRADENRPH